MLVPGLWDSHMHFGDDSTGPLLLSQGITSVRDPGNRPAELMARKKRIEAGELLGPRIVPSLLIDGPGERSAQAAVVVKTEEEAVAAVRRAKADGYFGVKLYGSLKVAFVADGRGGASTGFARPRTHTGGDAAARCGARRLRRDHAHQLRDDAGDARRGGRGFERLAPDAGPGAIRRRGRFHRRR